MKNLIINGVIFAIALGGGMMIQQRNDAARAEKVPAQQIPVGFTFKLPTDSGEIDLTVKESQLVRAYLLEDSDGQTGVVPEETLLSWFEILEIKLPTSN